MELKKMKYSEKLQLHLQKDVTVNDFFVCRKKNNKFLAVLNSFSYLCIRKAASRHNCPIVSIWAARLSLYVLKKVAGVCPVNPFIL